jgi:hypothetical protein
MPFSTSRFSRHGRPFPSARQLGQLRFYQRPLFVS